MSVHIGSPASAADDADYSDRYDPDTDFDRWYTDVTGAAIAARLRHGDRVLEVGCATGRMTALLVAAGATVVGVDRSDAYLDRARARGLAGVEWVQRDVVSHVRFVEERRFDHVVATNLLHELADPAAFVAGCADLLRSGGHLHLSLQNPRSLHRLVALEMGLIDDLGATSDRGLAYGTAHAFTADGLVALGEHAGLAVEAVSGLCLKPLPNAAMAALDPAVLDGFAKAARHLPEHAAVNYVVLRRG